MRAGLIWTALLVALVGPVAIAATSPLLQWREPVYIVAGFAGIVALALMLVQPLLAAGVLPGLPRGPGRRVHRWTGAALIGAVLVHVGGLWVTSPPDVVDALLFVSATPFSIWGVIAMWALFAAGLLAVLRARVMPRVWRLGHSALVSVAVAGTVVHAALIEGTMGTVSKLALSALVVGALAVVLYRLRAWTLIRRRS